MFKGDRIHDNDTYVRACIINISRLSIIVYYKDMCL